MIVNGNGYDKCRTGVNLGSLSLSVCSAACKSTTKKREVYCCCSTRSSFPRNRCWLARVIILLKVFDLLYQVAVVGRVLLGVVQILE